LYPDIRPKPVDFLLILTPRKNLIRPESISILEQNLEEKEEDKKQEEHEEK
jgi:hypothetical protein